MKGNKRVRWVQGLIDRLSGKLNVSHHEHVDAKGHQHGRHVAFAVMAMIDTVGNEQAGKKGDEF